MAQLLFLTSILLALSGLIKIRSGHKAGLGVPWLAVVELALAVAALAIVSTGLATAGRVRWLVPGSILLVIVTSAAHVLRVGAHHRDREARLGARLNTYVEHLSASEPQADEDA